jgi:hypothetical protein
MSSSWELDRIVADEILPKAMDHSTPCRPVSNGLDHVTHQPAERIGFWRRSINNAMCGMECLAVLDHDEQTLLLKKMLEMG